MSRRQGARTGLEKPRQLEREMRAARWRERRMTHGATTRVDIPSIEPEVPLPSHLNPTAQLLHRLYLATGRESFRQAAEDLAALGLDGEDMAQRLDEMATGFGGDDDYIASMVEFVMKETPEASELQAIEEVAEMGIVPASSFAGAVQKIKRVVYSRRPR